MNDQAIVAAFDRPRTTWQPVAMHRWFGGLLIALVAAGCGGNNSCVPGTTQACLGPGQCDGVQICAADGQSFGGCDCGGGLPDSGTDVDAGAGSDAGPPPSGARVFITSAEYTGSLRSGTGVGDGDSACQLAADAASLGGTFRAWLSSSTEGAIDHIGGSGPWVNLRGETLFPNRAALEVSGPAAPMAIDENGTRIGEGNSPAAQIWTGSNGSGQPASDNCSEWSSALDFGFLGSIDWESGDVRSWSGSGVRACMSRNHLLCFEQL